MYYIIEIQEPAEGQPSHLMYTAETKNEALSQYYYVLHFAAISTIATHTAICMDNKGQYLARETFSH